MAGQGFYYNQRHCIGCGTCQIACKDKNGLPIGLLFRRVYTFETGSYPDVSVYHFAATCNHCEKPICVKVCPTEAMSKDLTDGTVQHNQSMCIGCQYCVNSCPYGNPKYLPNLMIASKCDACVRLRNSGDEPACVAACPTRSLKFGSYEDLLAKYPEATDRLPILPDPQITEPSLLIQARQSAFLPEYRELTQ